LACCLLVAPSGQEGNIMKYRQYLVALVVAALLYIGLFTNQVASVDDEMVGLYKAYEAGLISVDELRRLQGLLLRPLLR